MKVLIVGSTGLVGKALVPYLRKEGHEVYKLVRTQNPAADERRWDPATGQLNAKDLEGMDVIINLCGENIAAGRWTKSRKKLILESRLQSTRLLVDNLARLNRPPELMINASAIGYYGDRGEEILTEGSGSGRGFLADVCRQWEAAVEPATKGGTRVVYLRTGVVLSNEGGALAKMLTPFKMGLGGVIGSGRQYMSWIALDDLVRMIGFVLTKKSLQGFVNAVSPTPVTNKEFTETLGSVLNKATFMSVPSFAIKLLLGEMGQELLLSSSCVLPERLQKAGFEFVYPELKGALAHVLAR